MPLLRQEIGQELRQIRRAKGLSLHATSALAHVSHSYIAEVEKGIKDPSSEVVEAICNALGVALAVSLHTRKVQLDR